MKLVKSGQDVRLEIQRGIDLFADTIGATLGPRGRHVILDTNPYDPTPLITNDGATIAGELAAEEPFEQIGAKLAREVASKTNDVAGDGTTTATVLFRAIVAEGMKALATGADPVAMRRGIDKASQAITEAVEASKTDVSDLDSLTAVATISSRDEVLGRMVAELVHKLGPDALITLEDSPETETTSELAEGLELRGGIASQVFVNEPAKQEADYQNIPVFVTNHSITTGLEIIRLMEEASKLGTKEAVLIANSVDGEALATCILNRISQKFSLVPIRVMAYGAIGEESLRDVAAVTGGKFFDKDYEQLPQGPDDHPFTPEHFGTAGRVIATKDKVTVLEGAGDKDARIEELEAKLPNLKDYEKESTKERIAKLRTGVGRIKIGAITETSRKDKRTRIDDAVNATKAALESGVVPGGGAPLYRAAKQGLKAEDGDMGIGVQAVLNACAVPIHLIAENASTELDKADLLMLTNNAELTIDFSTGEIVHAMEKGIIDPVSVVIAALTHAATTAGLFLTTESAVVLKDDK